MSAPKPQQPDTEAALIVARALADPQRYRILKLLARNGQSTACAALLDEVAITPATLSHHMKELTEAGLVQAQRTGRTIQYSLRCDTLRCFLEGVSSELKVPQK